MTFSPTQCVIGSSRKDGKCGKGSVANSVGESEASPDPKVEKRGSDESPEEWGLVASHALDGEGGAKAQWL